MVTDPVTNLYTALLTVTALQSALRFPYISPFGAEISMFKHSVKKLVWVIVFVGLLAGSYMALAQGQTGDIRGTITDPSGAVIPSARIALTSAAGTARSVSSGRDGTFQLASVPAGKYVLGISGKG